MAEDTPPPRPELSRRELLGAAVVIPLGAAVSARGAASEPATGAELAATTRHSRETVAVIPTAFSPGLEALETLTAIEMEVLEAICARLIPTDELGPGAREARAAHYIDRALAGALMNRRGDYAAGILALDVHARSSKGQPFAELSAADQDALLHDLETGQAPGFPKPGSAAFLGMVRAHTIEGTFCDPYYGGNADFVGWDLIGYPGLRMMVGSEDQRMVKPKVIRQSAYSANMFGRGRAQ